MSALPSVSSVPDSPELETLIRSLQVIGRQVRLAQGSLSQLLAVVAVELHFVPGTPATPQEIAAAFANQKTAENYWVVICGREPGLYTNSQDAKDQTNGVPNQHQLRRSNFNDALAYYANNYPHNVKKLVEVTSPSAAASVAPSVAPTVSLSVVPAASLSVAPAVSPSVAPAVSPSVAPAASLSVAPAALPAGAEAELPPVEPSSDWVDVVVVDDKTISK
ncbi:hypothetical protein B0H14DRAFT_3534214 [Mycena olivaceomarginata]|nr:hypothetical protein B0H14DRAFT_3534214 [Mycena olivaceomarginata]